MNATLARPPADSLPVARIDLARISEADTETLVAELGNALRMTVAYIAYLAAIWRELESRGKDLSALAQHGVGKWVALVAAGTLIPEAIVEYAGETRTLKRLAELPPAEQQSIVESKVLPWAQPAQQRSRGGPRGDDTCMPGQHNPVAMAAHATARDLVETIVAMIRNNPDSRNVATRLLPELNAILVPGRKP